jgi:hypothetical protein
MRKGAPLITMIVGMLLGFGMALLARPQVVEARTWPSGCTVPKSVGTLRTARSDGWLFFEDSAGVVRGVDNACNVKLTISRE